jgi:hypothetical protein
MLDVIGNVIERILTVGGIAGVIALAITVTICARYLQHGPEDIPQILTYSLTTIIGFYFGTGVSKPKIKLGHYRRPKLLGSGLSTPGLFHTRCEGGRCSVACIRLSGPRSWACSMARSIASWARARLTRLLTVPTRTPKMAEASS